MVPELESSSVRRRSTASVPAAPEGLAPDPVTSMLAARVAAVDAGDTTATAAFYTADAVLEELDQSPSPAR